MTDTIFAQATVPGRSGVAVIRISGPGAKPALEAFAAPLPAPRRASLRTLRDPSTGAAVDDALVTVFPAPGSFTGEDIVELHLHGSLAVCRAVLALLADRPGLRAADPGEFTRRALENGRLDLAQVEGLGDLIAAETEAQRRQALALMRGVLSERVAAWRSVLLESLALLEASIDFADEDVPSDLSSEVGPAVAALRDAIAAEIRGGRQAERLREGYEVALVGAPNTGKSTLLNAIAGRDVAITSEVAGTTRDVIELRLELRGLPVTLLDMAGLRQAPGPLEGLGVERARRRAEAADLRIFLVFDVVEAQHMGVSGHSDDLVVLAKSDLRPPVPGLAVSGLTGAGVDALLARLAEVLTERAAGASTLAHVRQQEAMVRAHAALSRAADLLGGEADAPELVAAELQTALRALDFLMGRIDVEAVLDVIFHRFCLGK